MSIDASDAIARCIIYDPLFSGSIHTDANLWVFGKTAADGASHHSAVLRSLAVNDDDVHVAGCQIAAMQNASRGEPPPGEKRRYYCGFRNAVVASLPLKTERYEVVLTLSPENGIDAHVDVALTVFGDTKQEKANRRTEAGLALAEQFDPAIPHTCFCDQDDAMHPIARFTVSCLMGGLTEYAKEVALIADEPPLSGRDTLVTFFPGIADNPEGPQSGAA